MSEAKDSLEDAASAEDEAASKQGGWRIWKLLSGVVVTAALFYGLPTILETFNIGPPLNAKAKYILAITAGGLVFKILFGDMISGTFDYQRHGYDLCIITLGASLSSLSLQITSKYDLFPDLPKARLLTGLEALTNDPIQQRVILLLGIFLLSCILSLLTARIGMALREPDTRLKSVLSLINFVVGAAVFGTYILMLVTKG